MSKLAYSDVPVLAPVLAHEFPKDVQRGLESIVDRVVAHALIEGSPRTLFLHVYLAGMHHAQQISEREARHEP